MTLLRLTPVPFTVALILAAWLVQRPFHRPQGKR